MEEKAGRHAGHRQARNRERKRQGTKWSEERLKKAIKEGRGKIQREDVRGKKFK